MVTMQLQWLYRMLILPGLFSQLNVYAEPFIPDSDEQVLEQLPVNALAFNQALRSQRTRLEQNPEDLKLATELAWRYIEQGRASADPRYYGYAQSALTPWWTLAEPPAAILLLRATLKQNRHDFSSALADLDRLLQLQPRNAQAWLTRAILLTVTGEHQQALQSCMPLLKLTRQLTATTCISHALSLSGKAEQAFEVLHNALSNVEPEITDLNRADRLWALTLMAELAVRVGKNQAAEDYFQQALALNGDDVYLLNAYADYLLDQQRYQDVYELLEGQQQFRIDSLLLRLILAEQKLNLDTWRSHKDELFARVQAAQQRGDQTHLGDHARLYLQLLNEPEQALNMALSNWQLQREPRDALIVLKSAAAAKDPLAAREVIDWIQQSGLEDVRLKALIEQLTKQSEELKG